VMSEKIPTKYVVVPSMRATHTRRAELREGLETMHFSRTHRISAILAGLFFLAGLVVLLALPATARAQSSEELTITADGVGNAELGLTANELAEALGPDFDLGNEVRITVDFDGRVVVRDGSVQFRAAMTDNGEQLNLFIVSNPEYSTAEGVGPMTTIAEAEAAYGEATLSWNPDNEGREFVSFENGPEGRIAFRTPGIGGTNVGIYADGEFATTEYEPDAAIAAVWVSCVPGRDCPQDDARATPDPTATPEPEATAEPEATPVPTATPEPQATPKPTATPEPEPTPTQATGGSGTDDELPRTGATQLVLLSVISMLFVLGGAFIVIERQHLCPAWLTDS